MCCTGMADDQRLTAEPQRVRAGNRAVGGVGKLEIAHGIEPNHPNPVGHERVFASFGGEHSTVRMGNHLGSEPAKHNCTKLVIRMVMSQHQPFDRLPGDPADGLDQLLALLRAGQGVNHNDTLAGDHEARVGLPLRPPPGISDGGIHVWSQTADGRGRRWLRSRAGEEPGNND
jgi:hypothetical protein